LNRELEQRVEDKTCEVLRNLHVLQVSQEILEQLPVAVIGIGDDGVIAIANRSAHRLYAADGARGLLGEAAADVVPADLLALSGEKLKQTIQRPHQLADGRVVKCWCCPMGESSPSKGVVLVVDADV
jgi:nitrogen fixation/metabolism regulation signal transduction histidine kinase